MAQAQFASILQYVCAPDTLPESTGILSASRMNALTMIIGAQATF
ncbi:hypothetical protein CEV33_3488 [Brucella grignonensis]|uniref:Uncharacterized protein n=1 Tax=Brucella grignonensis TaxID=94627 RepID=A0A256EYZ9_9HYPH|nr:hypothetical protein CEV33_3488 [Brucella grignonensis]